MIIKPRIRGFICTTAHPVGCAAHVQEQIDETFPLENAPRKVLVVGASAGYGLASRVVTAFGGGAGTLGVSFERAPAERKTGSAGWYNNRAFEAVAHEQGMYAKTFDGDAFADAMKRRVVEEIRSNLGEIDLLVYSLAAPVRQHPRTGEVYRSHIKPLGQAFHVKSLNVDKAEVSEVDLEPATEAETAATVAVMGGEDWEFWIEALREAGVLAPGFKTIAYNYIGSELTWPIYWNATLGKAKEDLDRARASISRDLKDIGGEAHVAVLKAVVSQASAAIPVVPLYISVLFKVMKEAGNHETILEHVQRLFSQQLYGTGVRNIDDVGRIRVDDWELSAAVQDEVKRRWPLVSTENIEQLADLAGYRSDFLKIFGFGLEDVDYEADVDPLVTGTASES